MKNKAIFLDRDGIINKEVENLYKKEEIVLIEGIPEILKILKENKFKLIVVSNQPVIARGIATEEEIQEINREINVKIKEKTGIEIDKFIFCPHHPNANVEKYKINCECRKPSPGMLNEAAKEFNINLKESWMIGDRTSDIIAGKNAGCKTILIEKEYSYKKIEGKNYDSEILADYILKDQNKLVEIILKEKKISKAIILSAGLGTRMGDVTKRIPKVMLELKGKPLLLHNIEKLKEYGVKEFYLNLHYLPETIINYFGDGSKFGVKISYNLEPELLGTSGALNAFKECLNEDFFVIYGDVIGKINFENWVKFHKEKNADVTLIIHPSNHPEDSDIVEIQESNSKIINLIKKPGNKNFGILGNAAWYIVSPKIFEFIPKGNSDFIKDVFPEMLKAGLNLYGYNTLEFLSDVGTPERFKKAEEKFKT